MTLSDAMVLARLVAAAEVAGPPRRYLIAFSGGLDSTVLTHALAVSRDQHQVPLTAANLCEIEVSELRKRRYRVVSTDGRTPTIGRSILRVLGYAISAIVFWAGYLWVLVDKNRRAWHDHMASTWVVYDYSRDSRGSSYEEYLEQTESF